MASASGLTSNREAAKAVGRCYGALFFSVFGGAWLLLAAYAFARLTKFGAVLIAAIIIVFLATAIHLQRRGSHAAKDAYPKEERQRNDRMFGIINAVTWIAVFVEFLILPRFGYPDFAVAALGFIVGVHFFPMPPLYRHRANLVTGAFLIAWAIFCALLFKGDRMIAFVSLGSGVALWLSAAWALKTANQLLRSAGL